MTLATLRALGAPDLPPGHFYRVRKADVFSGSVEVELRRQGRRFSTLVSSARVLPERHESGEVAIVFACQAAVERAEARKVEWRKIAEAEALAGDHR